MAAKKPSERRQRVNRPREIGLVEVSAEVIVPPADSRWLLATREAWREYWSSPIAGVVEVRSDLVALRRLFGSYDEHERGLRAFRRQRFVVGSQGQPRLSPLADHLARLDTSIRALEDRFGLTPSARLKLGVEFGNMHRSLADLNAAFDADAVADPRVVKPSEWEPA